MAKRKRALGNIVILVGLFSLAGILIIVLPATLHPTPLLPPESPDIAAKRFAPDNAFFTLAEASAVLPKAPDFAMVHPKDDPQQMEKYVVEPGSLGSLLGVSRPDDDPEMTAYLEACEPAVVKTREALEKPYFLVPIDWAKCPAFDDPGNPVAKLRFINRLCGLLGARGIQAARSGNGANALYGFLEMVRLQLLIRDEWDVRGVSGGGRTCVYELARASSDAMLDAATSELRKWRAELKAPTGNLSFLLRQLEHSGSPFDMASQGNAGARLLQDAFKTFERRRLRKWIIEHREEAFAVIAKSPSEAKRWTQDATRQLGHFYWGGTWFLRNISAMAESTASMRILLDGATSVIALERHRRAEGGYPETLDALMPKYLDAIPADPFANGPLLYKRVEGDYQLYSVGPNQKDDGGGVIPEGRVVPSGDDVVIHWPRTNPQ